MLPLAVQNRNILRLATAQALAGANSVVFYTTGAIVDSAITPSPSLATLPVTLFVLGMVASILPFGALARTRGRKVASRLGTDAGMVIGLVTVLAAVLSPSLLPCLAVILGGAYVAVALSSRLAATDDVAPARRACALSLVTGDDVAVRIIGSMLVTGIMHPRPTYTFAVTSLAQALVAVLVAFLLRGMTPVEPTAASVRGGRSLHEIIRQPGFAIMVFSDAVAYVVINFLMIAASLSMYTHGFSQQAADLGTQRYVTAMYGPGFFTGRLVQRFDAVRMVVAGSLTTAASVAAGLGDLGVYHYWLSLILLDIDWDFGSIGASAKIIDLHRLEEKTQVQSLNDSLVSSVMVVGSFSSGVLLNAFGQNVVLWDSLVLVAMALLTLLLHPLSPLRAQRLACHCAGRLLPFSATHY